MEQQEKLELNNSAKKEWVNRRNRRHYLKQVGVLRSKSKLNFRDWYNVMEANVTNGKKRHFEYENITRDNLAEQLSKIEQSLILNCNQAGYTKEEIDSYIADWQESLKPWPNF
jgi:hypothetical protein